MLITADRGRLSAIWRASSLIGLAVIATAVSAGCREFRGDALQASASDQWTRSYDVAPDSQFQVITANGSVTFERGSGPKVEVTADRTVKAASESTAKDVLGRVSIREDITPEKTVLQTESLSGLIIGVDITVNYHVLVPPGVRTWGRTINGNITLNALDAPAVASLENGNVTATNVSRGIEVRAVNGNVTASLATFAGESVDLRTTNGTIDLTIPPDVSASLIANTTNGSVDISPDLKWEPTDENAPVRERARRSRVRGKFNAGGPPIELNSVNGGIRVRPKA